MAYSMSFDKDALTGKAIPPGLYSVRLVGFRPKWDKSKTGVTFNPRMEIFNHGELDKTPIYDTLSSKAGFTQWDFAHCFGLELEDQGNGQYALPGTWDGDLAKFKADDPSTWQYEGPLVGRDGQIEIGTDMWEGKERSKVRRYICAVQDCATRFPDNKHIEDMLKKK